MTLVSRIQPLQHPGPVALHRRTSVATRSVSRQVVLPAGTRLIDAAAAAIESLGAASGQIELLDGFFSKVSYCIPALCYDGSAAATFSETHHAITPARLIAGSIVVGFRDGQRWAHCHAAWFDAHGTVKGGHVWPDTIIGPSPIHAVVHALPDAELINATDTETGLPVFTPQRADHGRPDIADSRTVVSRVAPGMRVDTAIRDVMRDFDFQRASIAGTVGSLVGAVFHRDGDVLVMEGPATEVSLTGEFDLRFDGDEGARISGLAIDRFGGVAFGEFVKEETIVAITLELLVEEIRH